MKVQTIRLAAMLSVGALGLSTCSRTSSEEETMEVRRVADEHAVSLGMRGAGERVTVEDAGQTWLVTYHGREGWAGGDSRVWVDKRTKQVVDAIGDQ
jgi:hypothetical protein